MSKEKRKSSVRYSPEVRSERCGWCWSMGATMPRSGRRSARSRRRSAARRRRCEVGAAGRARPGHAAGPTSDGARADQGAGAREPRAAASQRDPAQGVGVFCDGGARPPIEAMIAFIDDHRAVYGVEPICRVLPIAPSTYHAMSRGGAIRRACRPGRGGTRSCGPRSGGSGRRTSGSTARARSGGSLRREGIAVARCTVARLMRQMGLRAPSAARPKTTISDKAAPCPRDKVNRQFRAPRPNALWVSDFTYVATWQGFVYVAFVIDVFARRIVGWRVSRSAHDRLRPRCPGAGAATIAGPSRGAA